MVMMTPIFGFAWGSTSIDTRFYSTMTIVGTLQFGLGVCYIMGPIVHAISLCRGGGIGGTNFILQRNKQAFSILQPKHFHFPFYKIHAFPKNHHFVEFQHISTTLGRKVLLGSMSIDPPLTEPPLCNIFLIIDTRKYSLSPVCFSVTTMDSVYKHLSLVNL